jgi:hypothetical protein
MIEYRHGQDLACMGLAECCIKVKLDESWKCFGVLAGRVRAGHVLKHLSLNIEHSREARYPICRALALHAMPEENGDSSLGSSELL